VRGTVTARQRFHERLFGKMSLTKNHINEPHDSPSCQSILLRPAHQ
jgi:hypothetical protein